MKLNAAAEMLPLSRPEFMNMHPLVPEDQAEGYRELISNLSEGLKIIYRLLPVSACNPTPVRQANMQDSASSVPIWKV